MLMQYQRQTAVKVELSSSPSNYLQRRPVTDAVYRRRAVVFSLLWNAPPYPVMTPSARAELGLQMLNDENLPGYIEKVLECEFFLLIIPKEMH
ncbi:unnamed protein product [Heligmosomoides polygyrus]|uniref:Uncharacterized protein n=1 Tax=Heligmosomoides polygyrus TaxID=6339 RepID=A0A183F304_HELPZ|nr:unnamed protein product [Heligmosomoides polygyrus]